MTQVVQAPKPLPLHKLPTPPPITINETSCPFDEKREPSVPPPSYPMSGVNTGCDLFAPESSTQAGVIRCAPYQHGEWRLQPLYNKGFHFVYDIDTGNLWTRSHGRVSRNGWYPEELVKAMSKINFPKKMRWLHCLRVSGMRGNNFLHYAVGIVDYMVKGTPYSQRRADLEKIVPELGVKVEPDRHQLFLVPEYPEEVGADLWIGLHMLNSEWKSASPFYRGVIAKSASSQYFMQMTDYQMPSPRWLIHKFNDPLANI